MARGPFQGTWQAGVRPTVVTAPDAIVYINGEIDILGCGECRRRFDINKYITNVSVDLSVQNAPGSASLNLSIPRHAIDEFFFEGEAILTPMMEIEIYAKGFFLVEGLPQYYPIFWGLITEVSDNYSAGEHTVAVNCADILKWWELCRMNVNAAFTQPAGQLGKNYIVGSLFNTNVYDIIWTLAQQAFGDIVYATGSLTGLIKEQTQKDTFRRSLSSIMDYWNQRFGQIRNNLMLYGIQGQAIRGDVLYSQQKTGRGSLDSKFVSKAVRVANGGANTSQVYFDPDNVVPFRSHLSNAGSPNLWQSEFQTKLEIANICKEAVGYEFFMDVTGDIVFKPPFYNLDILSNKPVSWIQDIDIIDWNLSDSEAEVVTQLQIQGSYDGGAMDMGLTSDYNTPYTQVTDYHLLRKYGWRTETFNAEYLQSTYAMFWTGVDMLDRKNAARHRATVTIPMRPELRLGFPVYIAPKDQIWYISGISHNLTFGGRAQTTLTLTAKRGKFIAPRGIGEISLTGFTNDKKGDGTSSVKPSAQQLAQSGSFKVTIGDAADIPRSTLSNEGQNDPYAPLILRHPKTGRVVGYPNVVMAYTRPYQPDEPTLKRAAGQDVTGQRKAKQIRKQKGNVAESQNLQAVAQGVTQTPERDLADKHLTNRYLYGLTSAGVYSYLHDSSKVIEELTLLPAKNISLAGEAAQDRFGATATLRPVSDARGFELVGQFRYGRGLSLRDGSLVLTAGDAPNQKATVSTQVALAGSLYETLTAQSSGLSTISTSYPNAADAISRLSPEDLQTYATRNPDTGQYSVPRDPDTTFVDVAPLDSPQQKGLPFNVEASQLSRALTLAEMRAKEDHPGQDPCRCLMGRSDLAFINVGYQVQVFSGTAEDSTDLKTSRLGVGLSLLGHVDEAHEVLAEKQAEIDRLQAEITSLEPDEILSEEVFSQVAELRLQLAQAKSQVAEAQLTINAAENSTASFASDLGTLSSNAYAPSARVIQSRVESFLTDLYETLDTPHQELEQILRTGGREIVSRNDALAPTPPPPPGPLSPPFSAIGRARGGDLNVLRLQGETSVNNIENAWQRFGENLQAKPQRAALQRDISRLEKKLYDLNLEEERLREVQRTGSQSLSPTGDVGQQLARIPTERSNAQRELDGARTRLSNLNNEVNP